MRKYRYIFTVLFSLIFLSNLFSQAISIPYVCSFENSVEISKWQLNLPTTNSYKEKWIIGSDAKKEGHIGLYISNDGYTAQYGLATNMIVAYREFSISARNSYDISFDWKSTGKKGISDLYVVLLPQGYIPPKSNSGSSSIPSVIKQFQVGQLNNALQWQNFSFTQTLRANEIYHLVFVWSNNNTDTTLVNPIGACIDNLRITSTNCQKPTSLDISTSCDTTWINWKGSSSYYQVEYRHINDLRWNILESFNTTKVFITNLTEGVHDFRVRAICASDTSAYLTQNSVMVFCPEQHCINYTALKDVTSVRAYTGTALNPLLKEEVVDYGMDNIMSRHTVIWDVDASDPRTGNKLKLIPEGEFASVRLGNWDVGAQGESLVYPFFIDENSSILLLKYAIVLEEPGHIKEQQPHFTVEILDENNNLISSSCGMSEFYPTSTLAGWNLAKDAVTWKDWTTMGFNLSAYIGKQLKVRLSTRDCTLNGHYGYAYFTLNCTAETITTNNCGDSSFISAPDGFEYEWYNPLLPNNIWHTQNINVSPSDTSIYYCNLRSLVDTICSFTLSASFQPRFPIADFSYSYSFENCRNILRFTNTSHIITLSNGNEVHTSQPCESYYWDFGNDNYSMLENPEYICNKDEDTINVTLYAYISEKLCFNDTTIQIILPRIREIMDTIYHEICKGDIYYPEEGFSIIEDNNSRQVFTKTEFSSLGCDSTTTIIVTKLPSYQMYEQLQISGFDLPYAIGDTILEVGTNSGEYRIYSQTTSGCDSIINLTLEVVTSGLSDLYIENFNIYPNPVKLGEPAYTNNIFDTKELNRLTVDVFNTTGMLIASYQPTKHPVDVTKHIQNKGLYIIRITTTENRILLGKITVL